MNRTLFDSGADEAAGAKAVFVLLGVAITLIISLVMYFIILCKGYRMSVQSWGWIIFMFISIAITTTIKDMVIKFIKEKL